MRSDKHSCISRHTAMRLQKYGTSQTQEPWLVLVLPVRSIKTGMSVRILYKAQLPATRIAPGVKISTRLESKRCLRRCDSQSLSERCLVEDGDNNDGAARVVSLGLTTDVPPAMWGMFLRWEDVSNRSTRNEFGEFKRDRHDLCLHNDVIFRWEHEIIWKYPLKVWSIKMVKESLRDLLKTNVPRTKTAGGNCRLCLLKLNVILFFIYLILKMFSLRNRKINLNIRTYTSIILSVCWDEVSY